MTEVFMGKSRPRSRFSQTPSIKEDFNKYHNMFKCYYIQWANHFFGLLSCKRLIFHYVLSLLNSSSRIVTNKMHNTFNKHHKMSPNTLPSSGTFHQDLTEHFLTSIKIYAPTKISSNPGYKCINWNYNQSTLFQILEFSTHLPTSFIIMIFLESFENKLCDSKTAKNYRIYWNIIIDSLQQSIAIFIDVPFLLLMHRYCSRNIAINQ